MTVILAPDERTALAALVDTLTTAGAIRDPRWKAAFAAVPRHLFVPSPYEQTTGPNGITHWTPTTNHGRDTWLNAIYSDRTLVTALDPTTGTPTSSSTLPSLMARMLEDLDVADGHRVLEVGTGTGYNAALLSHRLGSDQVTSIDVDSDLVDVAAAHLDDAGYSPHLAVGDGRAGYPLGAPYDRIIATCSVTSIPAAWLEQTRPGGLVLADLATGVEGGLVRLTVEGPGRATGRFTPTRGRFMAARDDAKTYPRTVVSPPARQEQTEPTEVTGTLFLAPAHYPFRLLCGLTMPHVSFVYHSHDGVTSVQLQHADGSWARSPLSGESATVTWGGPRHLWRQVEKMWHLWTSQGRPDQTHIGVSIDGDRQRAWLGTPDGLGWPILP
ncbi:ATP-grasp peptide maturase system methyltransferase [Streptomyces megasporus]|uniref:ATP-grasp peptide maturase system methyltransferase n=1 Tax=Streptomyces megasporus TaxID=44060 RepID=UPI000AEED17E|nr:ATP-grasp peptide maturase system methyltransferase [Streptomyces megasporus]